MNELILIIDLVEITINDLQRYMSDFYHRTGKKLSIEFQGSKGYVGSVIIKIEGNAVDYDIHPHANTVIILRSNEGFKYLECK